jgi:hypothetical protein
MNSVLWSLLPVSALPLVIIGVGLALIVGVVRPRSAMAILGGVILTILLTPFFNVVFDFLPWWLCLLLTVAFFVSILRAAVQLLLGPRATDHMVGALATDVVQMCIRVVFIPLRLLGRIIAR